MPQTQPKPSQTPPEFYQNQPVRIEAPPKRPNASPATSKTSNTAVIIIAIIAAAVVVLAAYFFLFRSTARRSKTTVHNKSVVVTPENNSDSNVAADKTETDALITPDGDTVYASGPKAAVEGYVRNWDRAISEGDYSIVSRYIEPGSQMASTQSAFIAQHDWYEDFIEARVLDSQRQSDGSYFITTTETFDVSTNEYGDKRITQQMQYTVDHTSDGWKLATVKKVSGNRMDRDG